MHLKARAHSVLLALLLVTAARTGRAVTCTWQSMSGSLWSDATHWSCGHVPQQVDDIVLPAGVGLQAALVNDLPSFTAVNSIAITGGAYDISGNKIQVTAGINNTSANGCTFEAPIQLFGAQTFSNDGAGVLFFKTGAITTLQSVLTISGSGETDLLGSVTGNATAGLIKNGVGKLVLGAANTYQGPTTISAGLVEVGDSAALGFIGAGGETTLNGTGKLRVRNGITVAEPLVIVQAGVPALSSFLGTNTWSGPIKLTGDATVDCANNNVFTLSGVISGAGVLSTSGYPLALSGANTFSGGLVVKTAVGQLQAIGASPFGTGSVTVTAGSGLFILSPGTFSNAFSLLGAGSAVDSPTLSINSSGTKLSGPVTLGAGSLVDVTLGGSLELAGGASGASLTKQGAGLLAINSICSYAPTTSILKGSLSLSANSVLPATTALAVSAGASFDLAGHNQTVATLTGAGAVTLGAGILTLDSPVNSTFDGAIGGVGSVIALGSATKTWTAASDYSGATTVAQGTLHLAGAALSATNVTVSNGARLALSSGGGLKQTLTASGGFVAPGFAQPRSGSTAKLSLDEASTFEVVADGTTPGKYSRLTATSGVGLNSASLTTTLSYEPTLGDTFVIIDNQSATSVAGTFAGLPEAKVVASGATYLQVSYVGGDGNDVTLTVVPADANAGGGGGGGAGAGGSAGGAGRGAGGSTVIGAAGADTSGESGQAGDSAATAGDSSVSGGATSGGGNSAGGRSSAGSPGEAGAPSEASPSSDSGCGCRLAPNGTRGSSALAWLAIGLGLALHRKRASVRR